MARGTQLSDLLDQLQAEAGMSLLPASATSSRDHRIQLLNRWQDQLYAGYDWDFAIIKRDVTVQLDGRYNDLPQDIDFDRANTATISQGTDSSFWRPLGYRIDEACYRITAEGTQGAPRRWGPAETDGQFELWPVPDQVYRVRFRGLKRLKRMVDGKDRAVLDDSLIVLHAASEVMKRAKLPDWEDKLRDAQSMLARLRSFSGADKRQPFVSGGGQSGLVGDYRPRPRPGLDYVE